MDQYPHLTIEFNHQILTEKPSTLAQLAKLYCEIWMYDENFKEYRQCPNCRAYFSETEVEVRKILSCDGAKISKPHDPTELDLAWKPEDVALEILADSAQPNFRGYLTLELDGTVIGFSWGKATNISKIRETWGEGIAIQLVQINPTSDVCYYDELGIDRNHRGFGLGKELARKLTSWMRIKYPDNLALLRTHKDAKARSIYEDLGYKVFAGDSEYGQGRVMMYVDRCANLLTD